MPSWPGVQSYIAGMIGPHCHAPKVPETHELFPKLASNHDLPDLTSLVAGITGMSHHDWVIFLTLAFL
jgi:hypothetical protein